MDQQEREKASSRQHQPPFELLTEVEAAELLRISPSHLKRLVDLGEGPPRTKLGDRRIAYPLDGLTAWVRHRTTAL